MEVTETASQVWGFASRKSAPLPELPVIEPQAGPEKYITFTTP